MARRCSAEPGYLHQYPFLRVMSNPLSGEYRVLDPATVAFLLLDEATPFNRLAGCYDHPAPALRAIVPSVIDR